MEKLIDSLLIRGERIKARVYGTFAWETAINTHAIDGYLIATDIRIIWLSKQVNHHSDASIYHYIDLDHINTNYSFFTFCSGLTIRERQISEGNMKKFLNTIEFFKLYWWVEKTKGKTENILY